MEAILEYQKNCSANIIITSQDIMSLILNALSSVRNILQTDTPNLINFYRCIVILVLQKNTPFLFICIDLSGKFTNPSGQGGMVG